MDDPWDWTVDQTIQAFCHTRDLWADRPSAPLPGNLKQIVRDNAIDGASLLEITPADLKNEFGISIWSERSSIIYAIGKLRSQSNKYASHRAEQLRFDDRVKALARESSPAATPVRPPSIHLVTPPTDLRHPRLADPRHLTPTSTAHDEVSVDVDVPKARSEESLVESGRRKRRKLQHLTYVGPVNVETKTEMNTNAFFGRQKLVVDGLFYTDNTSYDQVDADSEPEGDNGLFVEFSGAPPVGQSEFVKRRMHHFLQSGVQHLDASRAIRQPYPDRLVEPGNTQHVTLFAKEGNTLTAQKRNALFINSDLSCLDEQTGGNASWDFLARWSKQHGEDKVLPVYGDSDSGDDDYSSLAREMSMDLREDEEAASRNHCISPEEVEKVVTETIDGFVDDWNLENLPRRQHHAISVWNKARGRNRNDVVRRCNDDLAHFSARLDKLKRTLLNDLWSSAKSIKKSCGALMGTVNEIQDCQWKLKVWAGPRPSPPLKSKPPPRPVKMRTLEDDESGISLDSESELEEGSSGDGYNDIDDSPESQQIRSTPTVAFHVPGGQNANLSIPISPKEDQAGPTYGEDTPGNLRSQDEHVEPSGTSIALKDESDDSILGPAVRYLPSNGHIDMIDLTLESDGEGSNHAREEDRERRSSVGPQNLDYGAHPEEATSKLIRQWDWAIILERSDRKRIVMKILEEMDPAAREHVHDVLVNSPRDRVHRDIGKALSSILHEREYVSLKYSDDRNYSCFLLARLYVCWDQAMRSYMAGGIVSETLKAAMELRDFDPFYSFIRGLIRTADESDDEEGSYAEDKDQANEKVVFPESPINPRKKRKYKVVKNSQAQAARDEAQERRRAGQERETQLNLDIQHSGHSKSIEGIPINTMKQDEEGFIYFNPHIADRVKPHQVKGVRFMWRELCVSGSVDAGCLLAHTMGLGKTMQTISILMAIAEAATSADETIRRQIPKHLRKSRSLILCPAVLVENWKDEFRSWLPPGRHPIGPVRSVSAETERDDRFTIIEKWYSKGGVLVLSYDMLRNLMKPRKKTLETTAQKEEDKRNELLRQQLLEGPGIVVADEAHKLKNKKSKIAVLAAEFTTTSRIALTGSPLANNLFDYFAVIDWVSPGYLGDEVEFKARYVEPIQDGLYADSTRQEQRRSLTKLKALKTDIDPKVDRADITALLGDLTKKTEFVIKLPLKDIQRRLYSMFVSTVQTWRASVSSNMSVFNWMDLLGSLCNHPSLFSARLASRLEKAAGSAEGPSSSSKRLQKQKDSDPDDPATPAEDDSILDPTMTQRLYDGQNDIVKEYGAHALDKLEMSYKIEVILEIIRESKRVGDQVLVFSHKIPLLNFLERCIPQNIPGVTHARLDGRTKMSGRLDMIKGFNEGHCDVFLISTRAGGLGLNITSANRVILVDFGFNPSHEEQAVGRAYRMGQKKDVFVYHLVSAGTFEEKLHHLTIFKRQLFLRAVDDKNPNRVATKVNEYLFQPREVEHSDLSDFVGKDNVMDRLLEGPLGSAICSMQTTETMHAEQKEDLDEEEEREVRQELENQKLRRKDPEAYKAKQFGLAYRAQLHVNPGAPQSWIPEALRGIFPPAKHPPDVWRLSSELAHTAKQGFADLGAGGPGTFTTTQAHNPLPRPHWLNGKELPSPPMPGRQMGTITATQGASVTNANSVPPLRRHQQRPRHEPAPDDDDDAAFPANAREVNKPQLGLIQLMQNKTQRLERETEMQRHRIEREAQLRLSREAHRQKDILSYDHAANSERRTADDQLRTEIELLEGSRSRGRSVERAIEIVDDTD